MSDKGKEYSNISIPPINKRFGRGGMNRFAPTEKAKDKKGTLKQLFKLYLKEGKEIFFVLLLLIISSISLLFAPLIIGKAINAINDSVLTGSMNIRYIKVLTIVLFSLYATDWLCSTLQGYIMAGTSQKIVKALRRALFEKFEKLPLIYHDTHSHGELMSRLTNDIDNISVTIAQSTTQLMNSLLVFLGTLTFMLVLSIRLTLVALITVPLILLLTKTIAKRSRKMFSGQQRELGELNGIIEESISGLKIVKAFNREANVIDKFQETNTKLLYYSKRAQIWSGFLMPMMNVITNLGYALVAGAGGIMAIKGLVSVGTIASFSTYSRQFARPLNEVAVIFNTLQSALAGAERVFEVLNEKEEEKDVPNAVELANPQGNVKFENVYFSYIKGVEVLKNISFDVKSGQTIAFVGATGAGKTTIVNLLTRFYDTNKGSIYIDGVNIKNYKKESLRNAFTVVLQDTCLFTGTIEDNIKYAKPDATHEEVVNAAKIANAHPFISRLKNGYNTMVTGATDSLSIGQRQLIAIARAVLIKAPILILDEATSSVDTKTELKIQEALTRLSKGRTSFIIAHRLSTIKKADLIMVVSNGEIVESGTHDELIKLNGQYAKMHRSQLE